MVDAHRYGADNSLDVLCAGRTSLKHGGFLSTVDLCLRLFDKIVGYQRIHALHPVPVVVRHQCRVVVTWKTSGKQRPIVDPGNRVRSGRKEEHLCVFGKARGWSCQIWYDIRRWQGNGVVRGGGGVCGRLRKESEERVHTSGGG